MMKSNGGAAGKNDPALICRVPSNPVPDMPDLSGTGSVATAAAHRWSVAGLPDPDRSVFYGLILSNLIIYVQLS
ncbi:hypothetical protein [Niveispirillum sp.]|uniref:hypothetical protein n=1 Tax=Niveispirillum sp. TaxID=1917217 RepID=UPI001B60C07A|nr:hypothetical protein [Niveispirillum sp.]MBP7338620.1 hypothetical protein [Niveispirillum sp.]